MIKRVFLTIGLALAFTLLAFLLSKYVINPFILNRDRDKEESNRPLYNFKDLIVNIGGNGRTRFLKLSFSARTSSKSVLKEMEEKRAELMDMLINILSQKSVRDVETIEGRKKLKEEIMEKLSHKLSKGRIEEVYFTEFVVQ